MERIIGSCQLQLMQGDIADQSVDAIVNAANSRLAGGGGVDGAIHRAGGPSIMQETNAKYPEGCSTGSAVVSAAGDLPARYVFHAVGPVWNGGGYGEAEQLAGCYRRCLELAIEHDCQSIAFPAISTGVYGYPVEQAAEVSLATVIKFLRANDRPNLVRLVLFSRDMLEAFTSVCQELTD